MLSQRHAKLRARLLRCIGLKPNRCEPLPLRTGLIQCHDQVLLVEHVRYFSTWLKKDLYSLAKQPRLRVCLAHCLQGGNNGNVDSLRPRATGALASRGFLITQWIGLGIVLAAFVISRAIWRPLLYFRPLDGSFFEVVDPPLLANHLCQSLFYLHAEPPGFNLFLGLVLKLFPGRDSEAFSLLYAVMGLVISISLYCLMADLAVSTFISTTLTLLFILSPASILFEEFLYNTYPAMTVLCIAAVCLQRFLRSGSRVAGIGFLISLDVVVLIHSTFQIVWMIVPLAAIYWFQRERFRTIKWVSLGAVCLILLLQLKNAILFGAFTTSSWLGLHLASTTTMQIDPWDRLQLVKKHELSPFALIDRFSTLDLYEPLIGPTPKTGIPVLDQKEKRNPNYNNIAAIKIEKGYRRDALWVITHHPTVWLLGMWRAYVLYLAPAGDYYMLDFNRIKLGRLNATYSWLSPDCRLAGRVVPLMHVLGLPVIWMFGVATVAVKYVKERRLGSREVVVFFLVFTILYVTIVSNALEFSENQRFRFVIDPFNVVLVGLAIQWAFNFIRGEG